MKSAPSFWYDRSPRKVALLLWPLTLVWRFFGTLRKHLASPYQPQVPTIAIGNITLGGTGKTPLVARLATMAQQAGRTPVILMRGYGGKMKAPHLVSTDDQAEMVGDEARWLAKIAPVVVALDRGAGARWIEAQLPECDLIIMDDGLQNLDILPHRRVAVFNGTLGIGNGMIIPAGPMRESWNALSRSDAIVITGEDRTGLAERIKKIKPEIPIFMAKRNFVQKNISTFKRQRVIAFAGIGDPDGFFAMLTSSDINLIETYPFPDHHPFTDLQIDKLKAQADDKKAILLTTEKDLMRLSSTQADGVESIALETHIENAFLEILPKV